MRGVDCRLHFLNLTNIDDATTFLNLTNTSDATTFMEAGVHMGPRGPAIRFICSTSGAAPITFQIKNE